MTKRSWLTSLRKTVREFGKDQCTDLAAALTYYAVLAIAPALLAVVSVLGLVGDPEKMVADVLTIASDVGASSVDETLEPILTQLTEAPAAGFALVFGLVLALWSASGYVAAFSRGMNRVYEVDEGRPIWKLRPVLLVVTVVLVLIAVVIVTAVVLSGGVARAVGDAVGLSDVTVTVWSIVKWPVIVALVVVAIAILYYATPNVQQPKFRWISLGAVVALVVWVLASLGFGFYVANFGSYDDTYGSLAGVIVFLLWLWITNLALLFGAELDAEVERGRQLQGGIEAEETIQLPPRDTRASEKKQAKQEEDVRLGRALRQSRGADDQGRRRLTKEITMYLHVQRLINDIVPDEPDPAAANALQEGLGGQFGEMRTMMQYLFQSINFRGPSGEAVPGPDPGHRHRGDQPRRADRHHHRPAARRLPAVQRQEDRPAGQARRGWRHAAGVRAGRGQHPPLPRRRPGRAARRCCGQPVERLLRLQLRQPRARPALQPDARVHRPAAEVPHLRDDGQQDGSLDDLVPDRARPGPRERVRQGARDPRRRLGARCCRSRRRTPSGSPRSRSCSTWACRASSTAST